MWNCLEEMRVVTRAGELKGKERVIWEDLLNVHLCEDVLM